MPELPLFLGAVVFLALVVESMAGFGATVVTVSLAAHVLPIEQILATFVPVNLLLSIYLVVRYRRQVDWSLLGRRILPLMGLGLVIGMALFHLRGQTWLKSAFALFVVVLALFELIRQEASADAPPAPLPRPLAALALLLAGVAHGIFACGGPLVVYVVGREIEDKGRFRATLSSLWLTLNLVLVINYTLAGDLGVVSLRGSLVLLVPLCAGVIAGEWIHARLKGRSFRRAVFALLLLSGSALLIRTLLRP